MFTPGMGVVVVLAIWVIMLKFGPTPSDPHERILATLPRPKSAATLVFVISAYFLRRGVFAIDLGPK